MARARIPFPILVLIVLMLSGAPAPAQSVPTSPQYAPAANPSLSQIQQDALGWLQGLLRIDTTNPPGNELVAAKYIAAILTKEGIPSKFLKPPPAPGSSAPPLPPTPGPALPRPLLLGPHPAVGGGKK